MYYFCSMGSKRRPSVPLRPTVHVTAGEAWYLQCLKILCEWRKSQNMDHPTIQDLATYCGRTNSPVWKALVSLTNKGFARRTPEGKYHAL